MRRLGVAAARAVLLMCVSGHAQGVRMADEADGGQGEAARTDCAGIHDSMPPGALLDLLDPDAPADRRGLSLAAYLKAAEIKACPEYGYTIGLLHRFGPDMPGNLVPRDLDRARTLILAMAEAGYLQAYADLAEMEMVHGRYREAMKWTQVYLYLAKNIQFPLAENGKATQFQRSAYNGHLLARAEVVWRWQRPAVPRRVVSEDLTAYLAVHEERVASLIALDKRVYGGSRLQQDLGAGPEIMQDGGECVLKPLDRIGAATASYLLEVQPSGHVTRILAENFVPNIDTAEYLKACLRDYVFAPYEGQRPLMTRISITYGSTEGASLRR